MENPQDYLTIDKTDIKTNLVKYILYDFLKEQSFQIFDTNNFCNALNFKMKYLNFEIFTSLKEVKIGYIKGSVKFKTSNGKDECIVFQIGL